MTALPEAFLRLPFAHRALHDVENGRPENSHAAIGAAIASGYGIEIDLQLSADGQAMVFHDYALDRLTHQTGPLRRREATELEAMALKDGPGEAIPRLESVLDQVAGRVPLLIEIKDQDGAMGPNIGPLEEAIAQCLRDYDGPVAVMSFNPHSVARMSALSPDIPLGLTTCGYFDDEWPLDTATRARLRDIPDFEMSGATFISHDARDLTRPRVSELRSRGVPVLCWTIRSEAAELSARAYADNITFEGYAARLIP
ncbi:glycerophosphodiester phosphodiesterase family protein [Thalassococcus sp. S3]|uniref:glycerophosphodiester phosphodiesterase family protein n=1 Tax=Thalassococcus sp. S3 TaxID=2017482 RepID=UPI0010247B23|nr:glycerophosphodiester phosphodiesterase family protein [Thalassococcus sp. S3]QBF33145.1 phosphodiesterase [Thalassococcus sp. S3]